VILLDTNVLLDVISDDPVWGEWSQRQLNSAAAADDLAISDIAYAELSVGYQRVEKLEEMLAEAGIAVERIPRPALFLAGKAFQRYRRAGGARTGVPPDFFIGAHAVIVDAALITRDVRRYRAYFPGIVLIAPN
jgi:predicted nucleic acid-binding protein